MIMLKIKAYMMYRVTGHTSQPSSLRAMTSNIHPDLCILESINRSPKGLVLNQ